MQKRIRLYAVVIMISLISLACATVPLTGRRQLDLIPADSILSLSSEQYGEFLKSNKESTDVAATQMVRTVGQKIQKAVEKYMTENHMANRIANYHWEFKLIENKQANAWCLPGGKVVVYTGILPITKDENGLAVVIGHEVAHAVANHGGERMSQGMLTELGGVAVSYALKEKSEAIKQIWGTAFGVGTQFGVLMPFSRLHENEADHLGLVFMAMAGYDPHGAISFWERMMQQKGANVPEFLSTHPSDKNRIAKIKEEIPQAMQYYHP